MTTRLDLRTALRRRLEDTSGAPLWDDETLNAFLAAAVRHYGTRFPRELVTTVAVTAGGTSFSVAAEIAPERIARVLDERGEAVPRQVETRGGEAPGLGAGYEQAWRWWDGTLLLQRPAGTTGDWRIEHLSGRSLPSDDVSAVEITAGDEDIVVVLALATALERRVIEDGKRGAYGKTGTPIAVAAAAARAEAERLLRGRRRVRGGWVV